MSIVQRAIYKGVITKGGNNTRVLNDILGVTYNHNTEAASRIN